jgi:hypothetical protein
MFNQGMRQEIRLTEVAEGFSLENRGVFPLCHSLGYDECYL